MCIHAYGYIVIGHQYSIATIFYVRKFSHFNTNLLVYIYFCGVMFVIVVIILYTKKCFMALSPSV